MARAKAAAKAQNRRGSPEAIEKRRVARLFNGVVGGHGMGASKRDGRTEKRRQRLLEELENGETRRSEQLKPLDILQHVQELMDLGEPLSTLKRVAKSRKLTISSESMVEIIERLHKAYSFRPEVYRFVGIGDDVLRKAGILGGDRAGRRARSKRRA